MAWLFKRGERVKIYDSDGSVIFAEYLGPERMRGVHRVRIEKPYSNKMLTKTWFINEGRFVDA